jgi:outer membrane protein OmpA-like peptidoglycan-associated protein
VGLVRNEVRASIVPRTVEGIGNREKAKLLYQGNFFVLQSTLRDMRQSAQAVDAVIPVSFELYGNGTMVIEDDRGFPMMRGFPAFPTQEVNPGSRWQAPGTRAVDPFNSGYPVVIPILVEYEYRGIENYKDTLVHRINATYASRYQGIASGSQGFTRVMGSHKVDILIRAGDGLPLFMRDELDDTYTMADGSTVQFKGFTLTFGEGIVPMDRGEVIASLSTMLRVRETPPPVRPAEPAAEIVDRGSPPVPQRPVVSQPPPPVVTPPTTIPVAIAPPVPVINPADLQDTAIDLVPVPEGIRLTVKDIRFVADSAEFLAAERPRLDLIAQALKQVPGRSFLVEGHTAAVGRAAGEMELSIERAQRMVEELVKRGISADRFIYKGWGGTKPIGDNSTDAGRSQNRRVEITILD